MIPTSPWLWTQFLACVVAISSAGYRLCRDGERLGEAWGLTGSWVGLAMLASITSLPELVTGISAVTVANAPNIAVGDALGSCVINLAFLVVVDFIFRAEPLYRTASASHILSGAFGVVLLGFIGLNILLSHVDGFHEPAIAGIGLYSPFLILVYLVALRMAFRYEHTRARIGPETARLANPKADLNHALRRFVLAATVVAAAGIWLPVTAAQLADAMGWNRSFVGTLLVATATSLPELAVTLSSVRIRALDMAVGTLLGSNLFNAAIIAVDDLFYRNGPLLAHVSPLHAITAMSGMIMTALAMIGLFYRPAGRVLRAVGWVSIGLVAVYLLNAYVVFIHGE
ncbi:MAG: sodium:calcium antiporter [Proteobacteria bacterium]|nr:sodium:calcium antiporter [Pseudomonadota bacterium]